MDQKGMGDQGSQQGGKQSVPPRYEQSHNGGRVEERSQVGWSATEFEMRLEDWIWRRGETVKIYLPLSLISIVYGFSWSLKEFFTPKNEVSMRKCTTKNIMAKSSS